LSITRTTTRGEEHDFQSCTSRRSFEGLPGRHHRCRGLKAFRCDPGASFADSERKGGYFCFHVLASFSGAAHIARLLAKDADTARSLAGAAKEAAQDTAVSKSGAVGLGYQPAASARDLKKWTCLKRDCGEESKVRTPYLPEGFLPRGLLLVSETEVTTARLFRDLKRGDEIRVTACNPRFGNQT
jgi:hypothetical protein